MLLPLLPLLPPLPLQLTVSSDRRYICNNYNLQAPYYGMLAANMSWTLPPMLERVMPSVPLFKSRAKKLLVNVVLPKHGEDHPPASAYGSYAGIEMPGHIGAYDWMWDGSYEGQDAGQRFDAPFTAMTMVDFFDFTQNKTFLASSGYPFLRLTVDFLESYVRNDTETETGKNGSAAGGYSLHIPHGCAQEGCVGQPAFPFAGESRWKQQDYGDSTADLAFFKLALRSAIRLSKVLGVDAPKRPVWAAILAHLPSYQTDVVLTNSDDLTATQDPPSDALGATSKPPPPQPSVPGTVFAISANFTKVRPFTLNGLLGYAIVYTAAMYPATDFDVAENATWREVAVRTLRNLPSVPYNGAQQVFNAAVRVGYPPDELVGRYQPLLVAGMKQWPSFKVDFGSSNGMENAGLIDALNDMLLQSWRGYLEFFPCWPPSKSGSFARGDARARRLRGVGGLQCRCGARHG